MNHKYQSGFIKTIILIIIAIAILNLVFGIDLKSIWDFIVKIWHNILETPFNYLWDLWIQYIWTPFINSVKSIN